MRPCCPHPFGRNRDEAVELIEALLVYEDIETSLFYQVTDQAGRVGNYLETSGSSAIAYTLMKGARIGVLPKSFYYKLNFRSRKS